MLSFISIFTIFCSLAYVHGLGKYLHGKDSRLVIAPEVKQFVHNMTLNEKVGQMTQLNIDMILNGATSIDMDKIQTTSKLSIGSYLNSPFAGGPKNGNHGWTAIEWRNHITQIQKSALKHGRIPMLFGIDSVHGAVYVKDAVMFGQQINAGAAFNVNLTQEMGRITGKDTIAAGMPWIFSPIMGIAMSKKWARVYETFGEDPLLSSKMGAAIIRGMQSDENIAACMKHFVAYSNPLSGNDRDSVVLSDMELLNYYVPPFVAAVKEGVLSAMEGYNSLNGNPIVRNNKILRKLLRNDMDFQGMLVTDWAEINNLVGYHRVAKNEMEAVQQTMEHGSVDMSMVPTSLTFVDDLLHLVESGQIQESRLDESVERIIQLKYALNLFETPVPGIEHVDSVGSQEDVQVALDLARESIVLLKNQDNILPLQTNRKTSILLTGPSSDSISNLCGGWSVAWQGASNDMEFKHGVSISTAMKNLLRSFEEPERPFIQFNQGIDIKDTSFSSAATSAISQASHSEYTIVVLGEPPYAEKYGDIPDLTMEQLQLDYVKKLAATGTKVILVLVEGRPRIIDTIEPLAHAILDAFLPCEQGGQAIAEIIFGKTNPSGRLPMTYPKSSGNANIPYYHPVNMNCGHEFKKCEVQWPFGHGLSYTTFLYSPIHLSANKLSSTDQLVVSFTVTNTGSRTGKEVIMLYLSQHVRTEFVPEAKLLKRFEKVNLLPGMTKHFEFTLTSQDWSYFSPSIGNGFKTIAEAGEYTITVAENSASFNLL